jgi:hypothetical protein
MRLNAMLTGMAGGRAYGLSMRCLHRHHSRDKKQGENEGNMHLGSSRTCHALDHLSAEIWG